MEYRVRSEETGVALMLQFIKWYRGKKGVGREFVPGTFLAELEDFIAIGKKRAVTPTSVKSTYYRAKRNGYYHIDSNGWPTLTHEGRKRLAKFKPTKIQGAYLMVIFDIEERQRYKRDYIRRLLISLHFKHIQKSVWLSEFDSKGILTTEVKKLGLEHSVQIYESKRIYS